MYYADIKNYDVANGKGVRVSLFVSGCPHHCPGCFNEEAWDYHYGHPFTEKEIDKIIEMLKPSYINGLSLLGGETMKKKNQKGLLPLLRKVKEIYPDKNIWCYTGYLLDKEILELMVPKYEFTSEVLSYIDVMVDGRFVEKLHNKGLVFRGSSNQRVIDVPATLEKNRVVEIPVEDKVFQGVN